MCRLSFFAARPKHDRTKFGRCLEPESWNISQLARYSPALKSANVEWNEETLDEWIADPQHLIPRNEMTFAGIKDPQQRADLLAFLKQATQPGASVAQGTGNMGGMIGGGRVPNLKRLDPAARVKEITYCKDTYTITTANGET
jgi:cytochrome c